MTAKLNLLQSIAARLVGLLVQNVMTEVCQHIFMSDEAKRMLRERVPCVAAAERRTVCRRIGKRILVERAPEMVVLAFRSL